VSELVSGWSDDKDVYLVHRDGESVTYRRVPARWSCWLRGLSAEDKRVLQRNPLVSGLAEEGRLTRLEFRNRWDRRSVVYHLTEHIRGLSIADALSRTSTGTFEAAILEGDVNPLRRLLSDLPALQIGTPRLVWLDLEVDSRKTFEEMRNGKARVLCWTACDVDERVVGEGMLEHDSDAAEKDLLGKLYDVIAGFDVVLSWNGDAFDFDVLRERTKKLRVRHLATGRPPVLHRWCFLDHMLVFQKYNQAHESGEERTSFALNAIAEHVVGEGKSDFDARHTWEAWAAGGEQREKLGRYCRQDTRLMPRIEAKTGFVALHVAVCQVTRCFPDSFSLRATAQGDGFLLALGGQRGFRFPTRRFAEEGEEEHDPFLGAYVMEPKRLGIIDDVHVGDFAGLYPSIMRSWNMSPDTLVDHRDTSVPRCKLPHEETYFRTDRRGIFPEALDTLVAERARYTKRADDAEPGSPEWDRFKRLSGAYKIIANSFYGIIGSPFSRYFDRTIAQGVTQTGAWLIKKVAHESTLAGVDPFYGDTDSVVVTGSADVFRGVVDRLNAAWPDILRELGCTESYVKLEFEKSFRRMVLVSAKRYAGRYLTHKGKPAPIDMKPEIKGLEFKRGDTLRLAREMQREAIEKMLDVSREPPTYAEMRELVARWRARVLDGDIALADVTLSQSVRRLSDYVERYTATRCTNSVGKKKCGYEFGDREVRRPEKVRGKPPVELKDVVEKCPRCSAPRKVATQPAHVRVARLLAERGELVVEGTRIEYLVVGRPEGDEDDGKLVAVPAHDPGAFERIDRDYYWMSRVLPPTARLLAAVFPGVVWEETPATRNKERKAAAAAEKARKRAGAVDDLPLFVEHEAAERRT